MGAGGGGCSVVIGLKLSQGAFEAFRASGPMDATEALVRRLHVILETVPNP